MRHHLLCKKTVSTVILVALAAVTGCVPAARAQAPAPKTQKPAPKKSTTSASATTHRATASPAKSSTKKSSTTRKTSTRKRSKREKGQAAPTPDRINDIQQALAKSGSYSGAPSGKLDDATFDSIRKFQTANGLRVSGKLDALTLQKLGLGSETAGVAAPTPPPNSTNRLLSSSVQRDELKNEAQPQ